jgi:hypothetical protein
VGNEAQNSLLFKATSPPGYLSLQFGPPIFPADIIVNPYGSGMIAVAHILGQRDNNGPDAWYAPQLRNHFVNYIDGDGNKVDLYAVDPQEFDRAQDFQFLP